MKKAINPGNLDFYKNLKNMFQGDATDQHSRTIDDYAPILMAKLVKSNGSPDIHAILYVCSLFKHANSSGSSAKTLSTLLDILGKLDLKLILSAEANSELKQAALDLVLEVLPLAFAMQPKALADLRDLEDIIDQGRLELVVPVATYLESVPDTAPNSEVQFVDSIYKTLHCELSDLLKSAMQYRGNINKMLTYFISNTPKTLTPEQKGELTLAFLSYRDLSGLDPYFANSIIDWVINQINRATTDDEKTPIIQAIFKFLKDQSGTEQEKALLLAQLADKLNIPSQTSFAHLLAKDLQKEFSVYSKQTRMQIFFRGFALSNVEHVNKQMMAILSDTANFAVLRTAFVSMSEVIIDDETLNHVWSTVETNFEKSSAFAKLCILSAEEFKQLNIAEKHALHTLADKFYRAHIDLHHNNTVVTKSNYKIKCSLKALEQMLSKWDFDRLKPTEYTLTLKINGVTSLIPYGSTLKDDDQSSALSESDLDYDHEGAIFISLHLIAEKRQVKLYCPNSPRREIIVPLDDMTNAKLAALILNEFKHAQLAQGNRGLAANLKISEYNGYKRTASADRSITPSGRSMLHYQGSQIARASSWADLAHLKPKHYDIFDETLAKIKSLETRLETHKNVSQSENNKETTTPAVPNDYFYGKPRI